MTVTEQLEDLEKKILDLVNSCGIHPSITKLILLNVIKDIEVFESTQRENKITNTVENIEGTKGK